MSSLEDFNLFFMHKIPISSKIAVIRINAETLKHSDINRNLSRQRREVVRLSNMAVIAKFTT